jgi:hypothetical protein
MIKMVLTRKEMDMLMCGDPDCKDPSHELVMHSKCHFGSPTQALMSGDILELQCAICGRLIFHIAIAIGHGDNAKVIGVECQNCNKKHYIIIPKCHDAYVWATYVKKTGVLEIRCAECNKLVYNIDVKKE